MHAQVSYLEIYNEQLRDLLCPSTPAARIQVMEDKRTGATVKGLKEEDVYSPAEVSGEPGGGDDCCQRRTHDDDDNDDDDELGN